MRFFNKQQIKKKVLSSIAAILAVGIPFTYSVNAPSPAHADEITSIVGLAGLGMNINSYTAYNYSLPKDLTGAILCLATNGAAKHPTNGETGTYACHVFKLKKDSKYIFPTGFTTGSLTYAGQKGTRQVLMMQMGYTLVTGYKDGKAVTETGSIPIVIRVKLAEGATTAITSSDADTTWNTSDITPLTNSIIGS